MESRDPVKRWISRHKVWTGIIVAVVALVGLGALLGTNDTTSSSSSGTTYYDPSVGSASDGSVSDSYAPSESSGQENARGQAENYLSHQSFSRKGLIEQLEYEGYSTADATHAVDNVSVDWNEQAALTAKSYLSHQSFSRSGLLEQLVYEGFTPSQAAYGVSAAY